MYTIAFFEFHIYYTVNAKTFVQVKGYIHTDGDSAKGKGYVDLTCVCRMLNEGRRRR